MLLDKYKVLHYNGQCITMHLQIDVSERGFMDLKSYKNGCVILIPFTLSDDEFKRIKAYINRVVNERYKKYERKNKCDSRG